MNPDNIEKLFLKPNIEPLDQNTQRIRRNLLATSIIGLLISKGAAEIDIAASSFLGIKFSHLNIGYIYWYIIVSLIYFLIHYIWSVLDNLKENMIRLTAIAIPMVTQSSTYGSLYQQAPNTDDKQQTSIHSWYTYHYRSFIAQEKIINELMNHTENTNRKTDLESITSQIALFKSRHEYIDSALQRYEQGFWKYQLSQTLRWLVLDFGAPVIVGCLSIYFVTEKIMTLAYR